MRSKGGFSLSKKNLQVEPITYLWKDRKRYLGMPISFTRYRLSENRIFCETGCFNLKEEEILLYRVRDLELKRSFGQRLCGVGTICVHSSDKTTPHLDLKNVKHPREVKELIYQTVENAKDARRMRTMEVMDDDGLSGDCDDLLEEETIE